MENNTVLELKNKFHEDYFKFYGKDSCIICGCALSAKNTTFFSKVWSDDLSSQISIFNCKCCGLGYSYPFLSKHQEGLLYQNYPQHHILENILDKKVDIFQRAIYSIESSLSWIFFSTKPVFLKKFLSSFLFQRLFQTYPIYTGFNNKHPSILDIGCGDGNFLAKAKKAGWDCYGTEYSDGLIQRLAARGITACKDVADFIGKKQFDVIRMNHVLEHLDDPNTTLEVVYKLLNDTGSLIIGAPNFNTEAKIFKEFYALHLPYHRHHYTKQSITTLLKENRFNIVHYKTKSTGTLTRSLFRKYKLERLGVFVRISDVLVSVIFDLLNYGDSIEVYAEK